MSPARRRRAHRQRVFRFGAENWKGLGGLILLILSVYHGDQGAKAAGEKAAHASDLAGAVASVSVSNAEFQDSLSARVGELEYRLAKLERRKGRSVTYIDTVRVLAPLGPQPKSTWWRIWHPFGR